MPAPTFGVGLAALPESHWTALAPAGPLRRWRLLEVGGGDTLAGAHLRLDERVLHYFTGLSYPDERLQGLLAPVGDPPELAPSQRAAADHLAAALASTPWPVFQLCERDVAAARTIAAAACASFDARVWALAASDVPSSASEREALARLWEREAVLELGVLLVECGELESPEELRPVAAFADSVQGAVLVAGTAALETRRRPVVRLEPRRPGTAERASSGGLRSAKQPPG